MSEAAAEAARRGRYSRVPTSEAKDEGGGGGSSGFKVGYYVVFCFRQPDDRTQRNLLNTLATMTSFYIHCEVCVLNEEMTETRTLYITNQSEVVTFAHVDYARKDAPVPWVFVWCRLTEVQRNKMAAALLQLSGDHAKHFSTTRIYFFHCVACCCHSETTTCSETTMTLIERVWDVIPGSVRFYSPDDVYKYVRENAAKLGVYEPMANRIPDHVVSPNRNSALKQ